MILLLVLLPAAIFGGMKWWNAFQAQKLREQLAGQFRQSLQNMVFALRAGVGFTQAVDYAAREGQEPLAGYWRWMLQSLQVGKALPELLVEFSKRLPLREAQWFAASVQVTQSTGGSLGDVLETLTGVLQEQQGLREKISALTAQGRASGILLSALPFLVLGALSVVAPEMAAPLFHSWQGHCLLIVMAAMVATGSWIIRWIVTVPVS